MDALANEKQKASKEVEKQKVYRWQTLKVYEILESGFEKDMRPLSFDDINKAYQQEAELQIQRAKDAKPDDEDVAKLKSKDIEPDTLHGILMDLNIDRLIYVTYPGPKYMLEEEVFNPQGPRAVAVANAKVNAFDMLITESGKYTIDELTSKVADRTGLNAADCRIALDELLANGFIRADEHGKISLKSIPPK